MGNEAYRHEFKYQCSKPQLELLENRIKTVMSPDSHAVNGTYCVRSMYFDSYSNRCFYENECGVSPREKFRIRIYNGGDKRISLECKRKEGDKTYKTACLITRDVFERLVDGRLFDVSQVQSPVLRKFILLQRTEAFRPAVIVEYDRTPYVYPVGNVRITLDQNIRSSNSFEDFFAPTLPARQILPTGQHLLEVKYDQLLPAHIGSLLQIGDLQRTTFSKYYLCRKYALGGRV